jgi:hypothetical protein
VASDQVVCMYMASMPTTGLESFPRWDGTWVPSANVGHINEEIKAPDPVNDLDALLGAVFALEGTTAEIYRLKSKAFLIKAKQDDGIKGT